MNVCECCNQDMAVARTCTANQPFVVDGKTYDPIPTDEECGDCGVSAGGLHHLGCEHEICPCCNEQRSYCNCANPRCQVCNTKMEWAGSDDQRSYYECPACGAEQ
jgi:hypothetical protein